MDKLMKMFSYGLGVSLWILFVTSCSNQAIFSKQEDTLAQDKPIRPSFVPHFEPIEPLVEEVSLETAIEQYCQEMMQQDLQIEQPEHNDDWALDYLFTDKELTTVGEATTNFFADGESVEVNLYHIAREGSFPFNGVFSSNYGYRRGRMHNGVDLSARNGASDICAYMDGVVRISRYISQFGNTIVLRHQNGMETIYAHNSKNFVKRGDIVKAGDVIAQVGSTGRSTGKHLHFEIRVDGVALDPNLFLDVKNNTLKKGVVYVHKFSDKQILASAQQDKSKVIVKTYHKIRSGDTLGAIARKYRVPMKQICSLNNISTTTILRIGRSLRIT